MTTNNISNDNNMFAVFQQARKTNTGRAQAPTMQHFQRKQAPNHGASPFVEMPDGSSRLKGICPQCSRVKTLREESSRVICQYKTRINNQTGCGYTWYKNEDEAFNLQINNAAIGNYAENRQNGKESKEQHGAPVSIHNQDGRIAGLTIGTGKGSRQLLQTMQRISEDKSYKEQKRSKFQRAIADTLSKLGMSGSSHSQISLRVMEKYDRFTLKAKPYTQTMVIIHIVAHILSQEIPGVDQKSIKQHFAEACIKYMGLDKKPGMKRETIIAKIVEGSHAAIVKYMQVVGMDNTSRNHGAINAHKKLETHKSQFIIQMLPINESYIVSQITNILTDIQKFMPRKRHSEMLSLYILIRRMGLSYNPQSNPFNKHWFSVFDDEAAIYNNPASRQHNSREQVHNMFRKPKLLKSQHLQSFSSIQTYQQAITKSYSEIKLLHAPQTLSGVFFNIVPDVWFTSYLDYKPGSHLNNQNSNNKDYIIFSNKPPEQQTDDVLKFEKYCADIAGILLDCMAFDVNTAAEFKAKTTAIAELRAEHEALTNTIQKSIMEKMSGVFKLMLKKSAFDQFGHVSIDNCWTMLHSNKVFEKGLIKLWGVHTQTFSVRSWKIFMERCARFVDLCALCSLMNNPVLFSKLVSRKAPGTTREEKEAVINMSNLLKSLLK